MNVTTYYISRVVRVPPLVACAAFDDLASEAARWSVGTEDGVLVVHPAPDQPHMSREVPAHVHVRGTRMSVALEIEPWSTTRVELGLRPHRWGPRQWPSDRQLAVGHAALCVLADQIVAWVDEPLRALTRSWESQPVTSITAYARAIARFRDEDTARRDRQ
jgi:hypothetical protein